MCLLEKEILEKILVQAGGKLEYFQENVFPYSFETPYIHGKHLREWAKLLQYFKDTCIIAPRKHAKSTSIYAYVMWEIMRNTASNLEIFYLSYNQKMAAYHIEKIKDHIKVNLFFRDIKDLTPARTLGRYSWDGRHQITIMPEGVLSFKRGRHPDIVILDDVLMDPTTMLDLAVIMKINKRVLEDVMSLPKEGGKMKAIGTLQTNEDFYHHLLKIKDPETNRKSFSGGIFEAIISNKRKEVLWPERFPYKRLMQIKVRIGEKAFMKEYMLKPVYAMEAFLTEKQIDDVTNINLRPFTFLETENDVIAGWDIGKKVHPSHFSIFEVIDGKFIQRFQIFWDGMDYTDQVEEANGYVERYGISKCYFDNTRGELEGFYERGELNRSIFEPVVLNVKTKHKLAVEGEKAVINKTVEFLDDGRHKRQLLNVTNDLVSVSSRDGHGDSFWSFALALKYRLARGAFRMLEGGMPR